MTILWLVRHGQTDWNLTGRWQGQASDAPGLNEAGRAQALLACEQLKGVHISAAYSSDLLRSIQTAKLIAETFGLDVNLKPGLREINLGLWEGMFSDDIQKQYPVELEARVKDPFHFRAPQGEAPSEVADRVLAAVSKIVANHPDESVLIVAHGVSLAIILCHALEIPVKQVYENIPENAKPYCVEWK